MNTIASVYSSTGIIIDLGYAKFKVIAGNDLKCATQAAIMASATGSTGATQIYHAWRGDVYKMAHLKDYEIDTELGDKFAIVKRIPK